MDLSVQKMQPPASLQGKSAAKKNTSSLNDDAVETASRDQKLRFAHGNTGYDALDPDEGSSQDQSHQQRQDRRKQRQLLSGEDLSELTNTVADQSNQPQTADGLMNLRAYQAPPPPPKEKDDEPHFDRNI